MPSIRIHPGPPSPHFFFPLVFPHRGHANATSRPVSGVCSTRFILSSRLQLPFVQSFPRPSSQSRLRLDLFPLRSPYLLSRKYLLSCSWPPFSKWRLTYLLYAPRQ